MRKYTSEEIGQMELVGYEKTKAGAVELAKWYEEENNVKCIVIGSGIRFNKQNNVPPWQVRVKKLI